MPDQAQAHSGNLLPIVSYRSSRTRSRVMDEREWLTERFEQHRSRLRGVAYRMLGSVSEADDALQEAWLRIRDQDPQSVENLQAWRCSSCSTRSVPRSGWRSCCTTCSAFRSRTSQPRSTDPRPLRSSLLAARVDGCRIHLNLTPTWRDSGRSSRRSSPPLAMATSPPSLMCSTAMSNYGSTAACYASKLRSFFAARNP